MKKKQGWTFNVPVDLRHYVISVNVHIVYKNLITTILGNESQLLIYWHDNSVLFGSIINVSSMEILDHV